MYRLRERVNFTKIITIAVTLVACLLVFMAYSTHIAENRHVNMGDDYQKWLLTQNEIPVDSSHIMFDLPISQTYMGAVLQGVFYFGHGYYGLASALSDSKWEWGYGIGNSRFLMRTAARIFGDEEWARDRSWYYRLEKQGIITSSHWITAYPWIASDCTFLGSIFVMGWVGWLLGVSWRQCLEMWDLAALILFMWANMVFFHIYITFQTENHGSFIWTIVTIMVYFQTRSKRKHH
jgi:hypothetical protein